MATNVDIYCNDFKNKLNQSINEPTSNNGVYIFLNKQTLNFILLVLSYVFHHKNSFKKFITDNPVSNNIKETIKAVQILSEWGVTRYKGVIDG